LDFQKKTPRKTGFPPPRTALPPLLPRQEAAARRLSPLLPRQEEF
jgi:hypothetical protein